MAAVDPKGNEQYYINGTPYEGVRLQTTQVGTDKYWFEGLPEENLTPLQNFDTGKFFMAFE